MDRGAATALARVFALLEEYPCFPRSWLLVRTHLVPKDIHQLPSAGDFRPLSIMSVWYRLWSGYRMHLLGEGYFSYFSEALRGGLPSRGIDDAVTGPLLHLEATKVLGRDQVNPLHLVSIDASKCFDRIRYPSAAAAALNSKMHPRLVGLLLGFWTQLSRFFSANGFLDEVPLEPLNGIPQGCPLSALVCNCIVQDWHSAVVSPACRALAYLDDRHLWADTHDDLVRGWKRVRIGNIGMDGWPTLANVCTSSRLAMMVCSCMMSNQCQSENMLPRWALTSQPVTTYACILRNRGRPRPS